MLFIFSTLLAATVHQVDGTSQSRAIQWVDVTFSCKWNRSEQEPLAGVVGWIVSTKELLSAVHPSYSKWSGVSPTIMIDATNYRASEHRVILGPTKEPWKIVNSDGIGHGFVFSGPHNSISKLLGPGESLAWSVPENFYYPMTLSCPLHRDEKIWVFGLPHPYFGISDFKGLIRLPQVPTGSHMMRFWHANHGDVSGLVGQERFAGTKVEVRISGKTDLISVLIEPPKK